VEAVMKRRTFVVLTSTLIFWMGVMAVLLLTNGKQRAGTLFASGEGTVIECKELVALMWLQESHPLSDSSETLLNWQEANNWAKDLEEAGYSDWRLPYARDTVPMIYNPTTGELAHLFLTSLDSPESANEVIEISPLDYSEGYYWTSSQHAVEPTLKAVAFSWFYPDQPAENAYYLKSEEFHYTAVRNYYGLCCHPILGRVCNTDLPPNPTMRPSEPLD